MDIINRLLSENEQVIFRWHLHHLFGVHWLVLAVLALLASADLMYDDLLRGIDMTWLRELVWSSSLFFAIIGLVLLVIYLVPFSRSYVVLTTRRVLVSFGRFSSVQEDILPGRVEDWQINQNFVQSIMDAGTIIIRLMEGRQLRIIEIPWLAHPHTFARQLEKFVRPMDGRPAAEE